jgi:hypothetical protein
LPAWSDEHWRTRGSLVRMFHVKPGEPSCRSDHAHEHETSRSGSIHWTVDHKPTFG